LNSPDIILPLAVSFFTFQQISFIVDVYKCSLLLPSFANYSAFVLFFPQLIAGPILKHDEFFPQLANGKIFRPHSGNLATGFTIFILGLYKKTVLADGAAFIADPIFSIAEMNVALSFFQSWLGVFAFSFQIYFDFSGYSDMAVGLARLFNLQFPANFNSPYKSESLIEFWRRWHISLSRFLREYIYIPLGGNRKGWTRRMMNLMTTMLIGGLWHGASWTFIIWGGLHGIYLVVNHFIQSKFGERTQVPFLRFLKRSFVFFVVSITWVFFRSESFYGASRILKGLFCYEGVMEFPSNAQRLLTPVIEVLHLKHFVLFNLPSTGYKEAFILMVFMSIIVFYMPNVYEWVSRYKSALEFPASHAKGRWKRYLYWRPTWYYFAILFIILTFAFSNIDQKKEFIYFQF
jgi:D-alanyl-lipoteichoic acid acyltransferase DltB (MBOAT superfamily)